MTDDSIPKLAWLVERFEPVRPEAWPDAPESLRVCRTCGAVVFHYAAAFHLRWHRDALRASPR